MPANLANHAEIYPFQTRSGNTPKTEMTNEKAGQIFKKGTPVQLNAGVIQAWDGATVANGIAGFCGEDASNYATDGAGAPSTFVPPGFPGTNVTFGTVPFEASAVNIPRGAPFKIGQTIYFEANPDTIFLAQFDNSAGAVAADWTPVQSDIGKIYGMTVDANGHWYVDKNKTGGAAVVVIRGLDPVLGSTANGFVQFTVLDAAAQLDR